MKLPHSLKSYLAAAVAVAVTGKVIQKVASAAARKPSHPSRSRS
jgi:hypothetical protein